MAYNEHRFSNYSTLSTGSRAGALQSTSISTQTLLNGLHSAYSASQPFVLDSSTSLVVNTWLTAATEGPSGRQGGTIDVELIKRVWEHARRRLEDGCIFLSSLHESAPSLLTTAIASFPVPTPDIVYTAISAVQPFVRCVTPQNPSTLRYSALAAILVLSPTGNLSGVQLKLSTSGLDTSQGLLNVPSEPGNRAFDVFYYLLSAASTPAERENLGLQRPSSYSLLKKSETYQPPSYLPTADDTAAAEELRSNLKAIGITGDKRRSLLSALAALLKLGETLGFLVDDDVLERVCEEVADLLDIDAALLSQTCNTRDREYFVSGMYEAIVDWVIANANRAMAAEISHGRPQDSSSESDFRGGAITPMTSDDNEDTVTITIVDIPSPKLGKAAALRTIFDDSEGINAEMKHDGVTVNPAGHSVLEEMKAAVRECEPELGIKGGPVSREKEMDHDRREAVLDKVGQEVDDESFVKQLLYPAAGEGISLGRNGRFDLSTLMGSSRVWFHLSLHPTDELPANLGVNGAPWSAGSPSRQLRSWRLPEWANRRNKQLDFTADFDMQEFCDRYRRLGCEDGRDGIESFILQRGWSNGEVVIGQERIWIREGAWWEAESMLDVAPGPTHSPAPTPGSQYNGNPGYAGSYYGSPFGDHATYNESRENFLQRNQSSATLGNRSQAGAKSLAPTNIQSTHGGDYGLGQKGDEANNFYSGLDPELADHKHVTQQPIPMSRRVWTAMTWGLTFWIPSFMLSGIGRMKRPDVRMAWREKLLLVFLIFFLNACVVFYIIGFGKILCPNFDKAWDPQELGYNQGTDDFYVGVKGKVYDISKFWKLQHSNIAAQPVTSDQMLPAAGKIVDPIFPIPLTVSCSGLVDNENLVLETNQTAEDPALLGLFVHTSGHLNPFPNTPLTSPYWFTETFLPRMQDYYKGSLVYKRGDVQSAGQNDDKMWVILNNYVYDLSDYFYTFSRVGATTQGSFLNADVEQMIQENPGTDITSLWNDWKATHPEAAQRNYACLNNAFSVGQTDFRETAKCQVNNYILLSFTIILCAVILVKFLSALQLGAKRRPTAQDKFVICQVPAYTEGEDQLRKGLDSLTALSYDNKRKLICVICDGMIVGGGNDRPTPKIVLDILGVDPKIDPPALPFKSVGAGSEQLNYGKVYSGLYEYEGNVVPYVVIVKVGKESEQTKSKPGNRGKRDSQILLMSFLNRVHHRAPMNPLELEMFHQINNIIGVDPELYEYLFMVDADTMVREDALNRLVASCANDAKIAGICGETSLENEERSWWTMIQVYEYYISHHLAKAFESLFGSVTCLPGCFCMYRLRTADKGKPLIISDKVINEYNDCEVDTLHKKNLLALGEDRYLTTLMTKHFPAMSYKFVPDAYAATAAPDTWSVLLSQRRRWINSTIHNLAELIFIKDMCGFCCFSMRFVVFIDLFGTIILPATCTYIGYLIYRLATHTGQFPLISIIMIAAVYGLQAIIFIIKRQWQHIGWMIIYLLAFPIYSFVLPIYSFWKQDDFSWGSTRIVIGEKGSKQVVAVEDEGFDPRSIPMQRWDDYATSNNLPGRRGQPTGMSEKASYAAYDDTYEMDDMRSVYSAAKPASTILTGFKSHNQMYMPPQSPAPFTQRPDLSQRNSGYSNFSPYTDNPNMMMDPSSGRLMSMGNMSNQGYQQRSPYASQSPLAFHSQDNLARAQSPVVNRAGTQSPFGMVPSRPGSTNILSQQQSIPNFQNSITGFGGGEVTNQDITDAIQQCLGAVDLDNVTKKQLKALTEQRLQCQLSVERRAFLDRQIDFELANM